MRDSEARILEVLGRYPDGITTPELAREAFPGEQNGQRACYPVLRAIAARGAVVRLGRRRTGTQTQRRAIAWALAKHVPAVPDAIPQHPEPDLGHVPPALRELVAMLPPRDAPFSRDQINKWLIAAEAILDLYYDSALPRPVSAVRELGQAS